MSKNPPPKPVTRETRRFTPAQSAVLSHFVTQLEELRAAGYSEQTIRTMAAVASDGLGEALREVAS